MVSGQIQTLIISNMQIGNISTLKTQDTKQPFHDLRLISTCEHGKYSKIRIIGPKAMLFIAVCLYGSYYKKLDVCMYVCLGVSPSALSPFVIFRPSVCY